MPIVLVATVAAMLFGIWYTARERARGALGRLAGTDPTAVAPPPPPAPTTSPSPSPAPSSGTSPGGGGGGGFHIPMINISGAELVFRPSTRRPRVTPLVDCIERGRRFERSRASVGASQRDLRREWEESTLPYGGRASDGVQSYDRWLRFSYGLDKAY